MNRFGARGPLLLIVAGVLMTSAMIAYVIGEAQQWADRRETIAALKSQRTEEEHFSQSQRRLYEENKDQRAELLRQYTSILERLQQIEKTVAPSRR